MQKYEYVVWFEDRSVDLDDQDREWVACFYVEAQSRDDAIAWGDTVAAAYAAEFENLRVIRSYLDKPNSWIGTVDEEATPIVRFGQMPTHDAIGW